MVASFFRVNAKRLRASEPLLTDLKAFAQQCKEDIADGPNPPPPPPTPGEGAHHHRLLPTYGYGSATGRAPGGLLLAT